MPRGELLPTMPLCGSIGGTPTPLPCPAARAPPGGNGEQPLSEAHTHSTQHASKQCLVRRFQLTRLRAEMLRQTVFPVKYRREAQASECQFDKIRENTLACAACVKNGATSKLAHRAWMVGFGNTTIDNGVAPPCPALGIDGQCWKVVKCRWFVHLM